MRKRGICERERMGIYATLILKIEYIFCLYNVMISFRMSRLAAYKPHGVLFMIEAAGNFLN